MSSARLYARYSTDRQNETSIEDQLRVCREFAERAGVAIVAEHSDEGISGAAIGNRPGVQQLLRDLQAGDLLLITDLERLARSQDLAPLLARITHRGVRVRGVQDGYDSDAPTARMQAGFSGMMSEQFRSMVAQRTRSALEMRAKAGKPTGGKAYGDVEIVREIFSRWVAGDTLRSIANDLNAREVPSPGSTWNREVRRRDGRWLSSTLHELLHNERYAGRVIWNRSRWVRDPDTGRRTRRERPRSEWVIRPCEPIVDEFTFAAAQARFRPAPGRGGAPRYLLSGLLVCGQCSAKLIVSGGSQHRYVCGSFHAGGPAACSNRLSVPRKTAEELILAPVVEDLLSPAAMAAGLQAWREGAPATVVPEEREVAALERLVRDGVLTADTAAPALTEARRKAAERRAMEPVRMADRPTPAAWRAAVGRLREILEGEDVPAARLALQEILGEVICRPEGDYLVAELTARHVLLATGTGRWIGSGGALLIYLPTRRQPNIH